MRHPLSTAHVLLCASCAAPRGYPSLQPRSAEAIDPRVPIVATPSPGTVDPRIAAALGQAVAQARGGVSEFERLSGVAEARSVGAGPARSERWVAAQQALSALVAQHGVTTRAAADIDAIAADRIDATRWLVPATRAAIEQAAAEVGAINAAQTAAIERIAARLR
jgi:hypothetical protein